MEKEAKKAKPMDRTTAEDARTLARFGFGPEVIAERLGYSISTIVKLAAEDYDLDKYLEKKKEQNKKASERKKEKITEKAAEAEEPAPEIPGQIRMDLSPAEDEEPEEFDQTKMMRFQAGQVDKLTKMMQMCAEKIMEDITGNTILLRTKLDQLNDTMSMILRAIRKE